MIDFDWCWLTLVGVDCCIWMQLFFVSCWLLLWNLTWKWQGYQWFWSPSRLAKPSLHVLRRRNLPKKRSKMIISELILKKCWLILTKFQISQNHLASSGLKRLANKKKQHHLFFLGRAGCFWAIWPPNTKGVVYPTKPNLHFFLWQNVLVENMWCEL